MYEMMNGCMRRWMDVWDGEWMYEETGDWMYEMNGCMRGWMDGSAGTVIKNWSVDCKAVLSPL